MCFLNTTQVAFSQSYVLITNFMFFRTVLCDKIMRYKPTKCTHVSKPMVYLQENGCIHRLGTVCFICINISSRVDHSAAAGRTTHARQVSGQLPDEERYSLL